MSDCPAAHSMDTTWFAVDASGNIGVFESGEAGGVPGTAALGSSASGEGIDTYVLDVLRVARVLVSTQEGLRAGGAARAGHRVIALIDRNRDDAPVTYRDHGGVGPFERALGASAWVLREASPRIVASREPLDAAGLRALGADVTVLGAIEDADLHEWLDPKIDTGVFAWRNDDYALEGTYVRGPAPADPIRLDELPEALRDEIATSRMPTAHFADAEKIDLSEHYDPQTVQTWGGTLATKPPTAEELAAERAAHAARRARERANALAVSKVIAVIALVMLAVWWLTR